MSTEEGERQKIWIQRLGWCEGSLDDTSCCTPSERDMISFYNVVQRTEFRVI